MIDGRAESGEAESGEPGAVVVVALPMRVRFRGLTVRELALVGGADGHWGEFCPFVEYDDAESAPWWRAARESAAGSWPAPVREHVEVNATVPAVDAEHAHRLAAASGARTAKVKVAERDQTLADDVARVEAVRAALGPGGRVRVDANGAWSVDEAVAAIRALDRAGAGLEYVEQPCADVEELAAVRRRVDVRIAADESIRRAADPFRVVAAEAADVAVVKVAPLGGVAAALRVVEAIGLPCVVSSAVESSVGLAAGLALAGALPDLPFACGLGTTSLLEGDVVAEPFVPVDGRLPVPRVAPAPDPVLLARYAAGPERDAWWRARVDRVGEPSLPSETW